MFQVFDVVIHRATQACEQGHILINGEPIAWSAITAEGAGSIPTSRANGLGSHELNATWKAYCIADEAQVLSFQLLQVGRSIVKDDSGFTISFKQQGQPEVLRLVGEPIGISNAQDLAGQWTRADRPQRLTLAPITPPSGLSSVDDELVQLDALKDQSHNLQILMGEKKQRIHQLLRDDFLTFCSNIKKCDSLRCIFRTTMDKLPEYAHILSMHCRQRHPLGQVTAPSGKDSLAEGSQKQGGDAIMYGEPEPPPHASESLPPANQHDELDSPSPDLDNGRPPTPFNHHIDASSLAIPSQSRALSPTPTPNHNGNDLPAPTRSHNTTSPSPQFHLARPFNYYLYIHIIPSILLLTILSTILFVTLRHLNLLCASLRRRASRSASREERRNRRAYRRAARQHAWRKWWNRYRKPNGTNDYEEKRTLILDQEGVLEGAMQDDIRCLTLAQEIVGEMVRAEEGRSSLYQEANMPQHSHLHSSSHLHSHSHPQPYPYNVAEAGVEELTLSSTPSSSSTGHPFKLITTHPRRQSSSSAHSSTSATSQPPPRYSQDLEGEIAVVDGFRYSPTFGVGNGGPHTRIHHLQSHTTLGDAYSYDEDDDDDSSPGSSVVDCSPRMSFDTGRSAVSTVAAAAERGRGKEGY